jgi:selenocysteine-specific elongation factor
MVRESQFPATIAALQKTCWSRPEEIAAALESLRVEDKVLPAPGGGWLHRAVLQLTAERILAAVQTFHTANPQRAGISREELRAALNSNLVLIEAAAQSLLSSKQLESNGPLLARPGWRALIPDPDQRLCEHIAAAFRQAGFAPPSLAEVAASAGEPLPRAAAMARLLAERGVLARLDDQIWMHRDAVEAGKQTALKLFARAPSFTTMEFRDALGVSRKFAVPLLDHLDKIRFTVRSGNTRTPGAEAKKLLA